MLAFAALHGFALPGGREGMIEDVLNVNVWVGLLLNIVIVEWRILRRRERAPESPMSSELPPELSSGQG
jgi:hypothetical protein